MSRSSSSGAPPSAGGPSGLQPLDGPTPNNVSVGGVFRLDTMAPGMTNAEQAMGAAGKKRRISSQAVALGLLLMLGCGMIYAMRLLGVGPLTTLAQPVVPQYDLTRSTSHAADHKKIIKDLEANHASGQVPIEEVQKNPFKLSDVLTVGAPNPVKGAGGNSDAAQRAMADRAQREADAKRARVQTALDALKLHGVIGGSQPLARISGEALRIGESFGEDPVIFTVKAIHGRSVELTCDGETYEIGMDDDASKPGKTGKKK